MFDTILPSYFTKKNATFGLVRRRFPPICLNQGVGGNFFDSNSKYKYL